jgi:hypothetical protein
MFVVGIYTMHVNVNTQTTIEIRIEVPQKNKTAR